MTEAALASLLPLPVALPIAGAVAAPLLARLHRQLAVIAGLVALGGSTVILLLQAPSVFTVAWSARTTWGCGPRCTAGRWGSRSPPTRSA